MTRPLIGISCDFEEYVASGTFHQDRAYSKLYHHYYHSLTRVGASCVLLPITEDASHALEILPRLDGVLLTGGDDYPAPWYGQQTHHTSEAIPPWRAEHDRALAAHLFDDSKMPVFAICGGMQILVIADGGELFQHIPDDVPNVAQHRRTYHDIRVEPKSRLHGALGARAKINSQHHQAVKSFGGRLRPVAYSVEDNLVEACEGVDAERYMVGVQWHPELLTDDGTKRLFQGFVDACTSAISSSR